MLELPLIVNRKTVDPRDSSSPAVIQLESAMGAAIGSFAGAQLLLVPRTRFAPVKTTDDLLVLRSDVYTLSEDWVVAPVPERADNLPYVELDSKFYKLLDDFEQRFPEGPPSLREARAADRARRRDVRSRGVRVRGAVELERRGADDESTPAPRWRLTSSSSRASDSPSSETPSCARWSCARWSCARSSNVTSSNGWCATHQRKSSSWSGRRAACRSP